MNGDKIRSVRESWRSEYDMRVLVQAKEQFSSLLVDLEGVQRGYHLERKRIRSECVPL